jgi:hypothetical protein
MLKELEWPCSFRIKPFLIFFSHYDCVIGGQEIVRKQLWNIQGLLLIEP